MTLTRKGLLFLFVLLLIQGGVFLWLDSAVAEADRRADEEDFSKIAIGRTNYASLITAVCNLSLLSYLCTHDASYLKTFNAYNTRVPNEVKQLADSVGSDEICAQIAARATAHAKQLSDVLTSIEYDATSQTAPSAEPMTNQKTKIDKLWQSLYTDRHDLLTRLNTRMKAPVSWLPNMRHNQRLVIAFLFLINAISSLAIFAIFFLQIVSRLRVIGENATRFAQKKPLLSAIKGSDEVSVLDKEFHRMADAVERAQAQKEQYIAMLGHDIRSPLNSVSGTLELIGSDSCGNLNQDGFDALHRAERNVVRVLKLVNEMLLIEKLEAGNLKLDTAEFSVQHLISTALDSSLQLAENRKIRLSQEGPDVIVEADGERLIQVLINLVSNAIKFSPSDSQITVKVEDQPAFVKISVCDLGRGVPIASREMIFERFKQVEKTDSSELGGVGLGLPICKMLVEMHGGKIGVEENAPAGSRFWFTINK